ncbi:MAG TPA: uroporphyrinogen decarboxylase family protein [bacterium]|nr:uroporphyrinogen decarboxylase family protein [bacterium]HOL49736.1 uroporphyrinogen decarboxylase family protein [bacterium]HPO52083.1 uroporphyrinogen decarboxylase family protein [bacterium]
MTSEDKLLSILNKKAPGSLSWTALVDDNTLNLLPDHLRANYGIDFYKHIGCDIILLNGWNTPFTFKSPQLKWSDVRQENYQENQKTVKKWFSRYGNLTGIYGKGGHPVKYPVDSIEAVKIYTKMWEQACFIPHDDSQTYKILKKLVGNSGVITRFWGPSTIPRLLEMDMGTTNFYYLLHDYPDEMKNLINMIHNVEKQAFKILAQHPCQCIILVENTSTYYISPKIYEEFNMLHQYEFVKEVKKTGKTAILHMCGHVRNLLPLIKKTECDGIHALTPPPTGDTPWELALDVLGEDTIIISALDPSVFILSNIEEISVALDKIVTPRLRKANFVLGVFADGISVEPERFYAVAKWVEKNS